MTDFGCQTWYGGRFLLFTYDVASDDTNRAMFDPYTLAHCVGGCLQFIFIPPAWIEPRPSEMRLLGLNLVVHIAFEVLENTPCIIQFCRQTTVDSEYKGDSVVNSVGDVIGFLAGYGACIATARVWGWWSAVITLCLYLSVFLWFYLPEACKPSRTERSPARRSRESNST